MSSILHDLADQFRTALQPLVGADADRYATLVRPAGDAKFGDYQANCAMPLGKILKRPPRQVAEQLVAALPRPADFAKVEVAGPGFVNLTLADEYLATRVSGIATDERLGVPAVGEGRTVVVEYSSPNVAKPMHVGHLRSTVIGAAIAKLYAACGWTVVTDNHLGDWGTQFGMLIHGWRHLRDKAAAQADPLAELSRLYPLVSQMGKKDETVAQACRAETAKLHAGDPDNVALWQRFMPWCKADLHRMYDRLDVTFDHELGESFYHPMLPGTVAQLREAGLAEESDGAQVVFFRDPEGKTDDDGNPVMLRPPTIVRKSDGAFTYATSDLATVKHRRDTFAPDMVAYVVDKRQALHFEQIFAAAQALGWQGDAELVHVSFGTILGKDGQPLKTRDGTAYPLERLLDEAVAGVRRFIDDNAENVRIPPEDRDQATQVIGIGAVKWADLSGNRTGDYVFDLDAMIDLRGNTAPYQQYVHARIGSIFERAGVAPESVVGAELILDHPDERALSLRIARFPDAVLAAAADCRPNLVCNALHELASAYNGFFDRCPVLKADTPALRDSRLALCAATARVIRFGLGLLGIGTVRRM